MIVQWSMQEKWMRNSWSCVQLCRTNDKLSLKHFTAKLFTPDFLLLFITLKFMIWNNGNESLQYLKCALNLLKPNCIGLTINWPMAYGMILTIIISIVKMCPRHDYHFIQKFANRIQDFFSFIVRFLYVLYVIKYENSVKNVSNVLSQLILCTAHHSAVKLTFIYVCLNSIIHVVLSFMCFCCCCDSCFSFGLVCLFKKYQEYVRFSPYWNG